MSNASTAAIAALISPILAKIGVKVKIEKGAKRGKRALGNKPH